MYSFCFIKRYVKYKIHHLIIEMKLEEKKTLIINEGSLF